MGCGRTISSIATNSSLYLWASGRSSSDNNTENLGPFHRNENSSAFCTDTERLKLLEGHTTRWWPSQDWESSIIQAFLLFARPQCLGWRAHHPHCCTGGLLKDFSLLMGSESWVVIIISHFWFGVWTRNCNSSFYTAPFQTGCINRNKLRLTSLLWEHSKYYPVFQKEEAEQQKQ